jgi:hypothetical protein
MGGSEPERPDADCGVPVDGWAPGEMKADAEVGDETITML